MDGIIDCSFFGDKFHLAVDDIDRSISKITEWTEKKGEKIKSVRGIRPSMEDVFVEFAEKGAGQ